VYFGVPLINFAGWVIVGTLGVGGPIYWSGGREAGSGRGWPGLDARGSACPADRYGAHPGPGVALYYAVLGFNLAMTVWIGEWWLLAVGALVHAAVAGALWGIAHWPATGLGLEKQGT
jgi:putative membrane protein